MKLRNPIQAILSRPLLKLSLIVGTNLSILLTITAWVLTVQRSLDVELRVAGSLSCLHCSVDGVYFSFLPPQDGLGKGGALAYQVLKPSPNQSRTNIERNLSKYAHTVTLPGVKFWRTLQEEEHYDRGIVRIRFWLMLLVTMGLRGLLFWAQQCVREQDKT